ncbi:MAG: transporter substrate-binding domain-containing protein [Proteobacteria bacterium]|nr:transporter substrate-binding domain-containing protein [Pseudomonadota bacterium]MBU1582836.1 transporter substrate-binding domain-containing protein [Pseudomonadota bacterium]MBU2451835.1 transporter substrate-binding domain-containing protein [Pseudomonadota bacterium]MBU2631014.1 transporter substrate-binding domain-containing protein [Pseudomonadota bacterium]
MTICLLVFLVFFERSISAEEINLGYIDFPPYEFREDNQAKGIMVKIVTTLFKRADVSLTLKYLPFKRAYILTKQGEIDGLFSFTKTKERLELFDFTDPIIDNPIVFFVRKDADIQFETLEDLKGLTIGVMRGYSYGPEFDNSPIFIREKSDSHLSNFKKILSARIHVYPCDKLVGLYILNKEKLTSEFRTLSRPLTIKFGHIGFTKGKHDKIIGKINTEIKKMQQDGEVNNIIFDWYFSH